MPYMGIRRQARTKFYKHLGESRLNKQKEHTETEFEKHRIIQDRLFQSDFDKYLGALPLEDEE